MIITRGSSEGLDHPLQPPQRGYDTDLTFIHFKIIKENVFMIL
jgi:hypothetical protein